MKFKGTWVLALFAIALGLYVYFIEFKKAAKDDEQKANDEKVINFDAAKLKSFSIKNSKGEFVLEKADGNNWKLTQPLSDLADNGAVASMLSDLETEKFEQTIEGEDLKQYGLDNPQSSITLNLADGSVKKVNVGADAPLPGKVYLQRDVEKKVLFANASFKTQLDKTLKDLRDKRVFRKNKDDIQHLSFKFDVKGVRSQIAVTKKDGSWVIDGRDEKADTDTMMSVLTGIENFKATDFVSEESNNITLLKKYSLNAPVLDLVIEGKDKAVMGHIRASPTKENNTAYATIDGSPTIFQMYGANVESLLRRPEDYRDKKLPFDFKKDDVAEIMAKNSLSEVHLLKKGSSWELALPDQVHLVSQIQVTNFIDKLSTLKAAEYLDSEKNVSFKSPLGHVVLKNAKGETLFDFTWGDRAKNKRNYYAKTNLYKGVIGVEATTLEGLPMQTLVEEKSTPTPAPTP